jgi:biotin synthase
MPPAAASQRHDWPLAEIESIYNAPLPDLVFRAQTIHREHHRADEVQGCMLLSIKTGGCPEDCAYCPQSAHYKTGVARTELAPLDEVTEAATRAREQGATRFCMGAAWRDAPKGAQFDRVLDMVRMVRGLGMEACCTLGMLTQDQAHQLAEAGLSAYNHNLDTSPEFYGSIITTRTYDDRLDTLKRVRDAGITVCSGGIIGMGESRSARCRMLQQLSSLDPHPESVPVNMLVAVEGTPLAGANSVFLGERLLTTPNPGATHDESLFNRLGMRLTTAGAPAPAHAAG